MIDLIIKVHKQNPNLKINRDGFFYIYTEIRAQISAQFQNFN